MKVLHINTYADSGGAGRAATRLSAALQQAGIHSSQLCLWGTAQGDITLWRPRYFGRLRVMATIMAERWLSKLLCRTASIPFSVQRLGFNITAHPLVQQADVLHLHWINHGFLTIAGIQQLAALGKPLIVTLHDSNAFTGGCHVRYSCTHYKTGCGSCPVLRFPEPKDVTYHTVRKKQKRLAAAAMHYIAPSGWMLSALQQSAAPHKMQSINIGNAIDTTIFKPLNKAEARRLLGIAPDTFVLISGFMPSKNDMHKGSSYLIKSLQLLAEMPAAAHTSMQLLIFGNKSTSPLPLPMPVNMLGTITQAAKLALCYAAADAFICPSLDDNLPNTVMESLACGTPVISFTTGGIPDMVQHKHNGYLAAYKNPADLAAGILWLMQHPQRETINQNAARSVAQKFGYTAIARQHIAYYNQALHHGT